MRTTKIYVGNLPENADSRQLQDLFEKYGEVKECDIVKNYAFVHMSSDEDAKTAIDALNNIDFMGSKISVEISHSKVRQRPGMGGKGQCYRCGRQGHWSKECPRNPAVRNAGPPVGYPTGGYGERFPRFGGMDRPFGADRSFGEQRSFVDRMRPYPDPYERRPPPMAAPQQENYMYYRRAYDSYGYTRRSPPSVPQVPSRYDFTQDPYLLKNPRQTPGCMNKKDKSKLLFSIILVPFYPVFLFLMLVNVLIMKFLSKDESSRHLNLLRNKFIPSCRLLDNACVITGGMRNVCCTCLEFKNPSLCWPNSIQGEHANSSLL